MQKRASLLSLSQSHLPLQASVQPLTASLSCLGLGESPSRTNTQDSTTIHHRISTCLPSFLPSTQPSPSAPAGALVPSWPPPLAICWAIHRPCCAREWAFGHGSTQICVPSYQVSMCEPCVCCEAAAQSGSSGGEDGHVAGWAE